MRILVLNAGSSSFKASVIDGTRTVLRDQIDWGADASRAGGREAGVRRLLESLTPDGVPIGSIEAVGHRVVHGGERYVGPTLIDDSMVGELDALAALAPLHNPVAVDTIRAARSVLADVPHVASFDTAFHATLPTPAKVYPVPYPWYTDWGIRRYGFHGLSVAWSLRRAGELVGRPSGALGLVVAHLGSGCSVTAVWEGRSVETSMGFTPLEGLMMGTRAGSIDPGIILDLLETRRLTLKELAEALDHGSGLAGVSGLGSDIRQLSKAAQEGSDRATLALEMFVRRAAAAIAAAITALPRLDALVFTGGIGERAGEIRARIVDRLAGVGIAPIDATSVEDDAVLSQPSAAVAVLRVEAREDLVIAAEAAKVAFDGEA